MSQALFTETGALNNTRLHMGQRALLPPLFVEILVLEPGLELRRHGRPFAVDHGIPGGVAVPALDDEMLAENAFKSEAEPLCRLARGHIEGMAFPFEPAHAQIIEAVTHHQKDRLCPLAGILEAG